MLCTVIMGPTLAEVRTQIFQAIEHADLVELRLDHFTDRSFEKISALKQEFSIPMIFTLRSKSQGGHYPGSEEDRMQEIQQLASCEPAYFDLEDDLPAAFIQEIAASFPQIKWILSHHEFKRSLGDLEPIINSMPQVKDAIHKIASRAHSTVDALQVMKNSKNFKNLISISMGGAGEISRILAPVVGSKMTYASLDETKSTAPGQIPAKMLADVYRYKSLNQNTELYGLIGDPISGSIGHLTNNAVMQAFHLNAVYVKMKIESKDLQQSLQLMKELGFRGLAVTMPLKETIIPFLDEIDPEAEAIGAVSFVHINHGRLIGYNKDGYGALESLEQLIAVKHKKLIILGAGGASRAIAFEAKRRGAHVVILNRTPEKAEKLALEFGCQSDALDAMPRYFNEGYDILINCTPYHLQHLPIDATHFLPGAVVMDITSKPMLTQFLKAAQSTGCVIVYGYQMFVRQTAKQFHCWFLGHLDEQRVYDVLSETAQKALN